MPIELDRLNVSANSYICTLTAETANEQMRRINGKLVQWDAVGHTNMGEVTIPRGSLTLPKDGTLRLLFGHDRELPIGVPLILDDRPDGLYAVFSIARTPLGDQYLMELDPIAPVRDGLSIELEDVTIDDDHRVTAGRLVAVAAVPLPAFTESRAQLAAEMRGRDTMDRASDAPTRDDPAVDTTHARPLTAAAPVRTTPVSPFRLLCERLSDGRLTGRIGAELSAAMADISPGGNGPGNENAGLMLQALGELWSASAFVPRYSPLVTQGTLTGIRASGFVWNVPPAVDDYAGNKAAIPSNAATLSFVDVPATRLAGGHDIDRIYRDLGSPDVMASYWAKMAESLGRGLDGRALYAIQLAAGTPITGQSDPMVAIVLGAIAVSAYAQPDYALVSSNLAASMATTPAYEAPVGAPFALPPIMVGPELPDNTVIVGAKAAVRQLTFTPPIRAEAVNIPNGGIDAALFSYSAEIVEQSAAVVAYTITVVP